MRIGILSDVHSNLLALRSVLEDSNFDLILHAGDVVGYNPFPNEVIYQFRKHDVISILGNHDKAVIGSEKYDLPDYVDKAIQWSKKNLSEENTHYLKQLQSSNSIEVDGKVLRLVHGSPSDPNEYMYPTDVTLDLVNNLDTGVDVLIWGHTHYPIVTRINDVTLLNPGSVGQPRDGDWRACYVEYNTSESSITLHREKYDLEALRKKHKSTSLPKEIVEKFYQE